MGVVIHRNFGSGRPRLDPAFLDHRIHEAAAWLLDGRESSDRHVIVQLRQRFGLRPKEAVAAIRLADQWRYERGAPQ